MGSRDWSEMAVRIDRVLYCILSSMLSLGVAWDPSGKYNYLGVVPAGGSVRVDLPSNVANYGDCQFSDQCANIAAHCLSGRCLTDAECRSESKVVSYCHESPRGSMEGAKHVSYKMLKALVLDPGFCGNSTNPGPLRHADAKKTTKDGTAGGSFKAFCTADGNNEAQMNLLTTLIPKIKGTCFKPGGITATGGVCHRKPMNLVDEGIQNRYQDLGYISAQVKVGRVNKESIEISDQSIANRCPGGGGKVTERFKANYVFIKTQLCARFHASSTAGAQEICVVTKQGVGNRVCHEGWYPEGYPCGDKCCPGKPHGAKIGGGTRASNVYDAAGCWPDVEYPTALRKSSSWGVLKTPETLVAPLFKLF